MPDAQRQRNVTIDVFRGVSILAVVIFHYTVRVPPEVLFELSPETVTSFFSFGWVGVYIFFSVSGFSVYQSLKRSPTPLHFIAKRVARIYIPFVIASTCIFISLPLLDLPSFQQGEWRFGGAVSFYDYLATTFFFARDLGFSWVDGVFWTLLVELKFYLALAVLGALGLLDSRRIEFFLVLFLPLFWSICVFVGSELGATILRVVCLAPYWGFFYLGINGSKGRLCWISLASSAISLWIIANDKPNPYEIPVFTVVFFLACSAIMVRLALAEQSGRFAYSKYAVPWYSLIAPLKFIGEKSYSWYLIHQKFGLAVIMYLSGFLMPLASVGLAIAVTLTAAVIFSRMFEDRWRLKTEVFLLRVFKLFGFIRE